LDLYKYMPRPRPVVALARSSHLILVAALYQGPLDPDVDRLAVRLLEEGRDPDTGDPLLDALLYASLYGGLILVYTSGGVATPISRIHMDISIALRRSRGSPMILRDLEVLDSWSQLYRGRVDALNRLAGPLHRPIGFEWSLGGDIKIAPTGFTHVRLEKLKDNP